VTHAGIALTYQDRGSGTHSIILLHGWTCDHSFLRPQLEHLSRSHRVLAPDLRGHGQSDAPQSRYSIAEFANDIHGLCAALSLPPAIVIGHSMGGTIALELAAGYPENVSAICLIDSVVFPPDSLKSQLPDIASQLAGSNYSQVFDQVVESLFIETDDQKRKAELLSLMKRTPKHGAIASFRGHLLDYDFAAAASACKAPTAYLGAVRQLADLTKFRKYCPQLLTGQIFGSGHFAPLEVPEQVNSMLDRYLRILQVAETNPSSSRLSS
jgi:pimeloyl-ACP methyl ester carboxylesterase